MRSMDQRGGALRSGSHLPTPRIGRHRERRIDVVESLATPSRVRRRDVLGLAATA
jgi:hypothetical protein